MTSDFSQVIAELVTAPVAAVLSTNACNITHQNML